MQIVYLCLTCLKVSSDEGACHGQPMVRCGADEPGGASRHPRLGLHPLAHHWLVDTLRQLQAEAREDPGHRRG